MAAAPSPESASGGGGTVRDVLDASPSRRGVGGRDTAGGCASGGWTAAFGGAGAAASVRVAGAFGDTRSSFSDTFGTTGSVRFSAVGLGALGATGATR